MLVDVVDVVLVDVLLLDVLLLVDAMLAVVVEVFEPGAAVDSFGTARVAAVDGASPVVVVSDPQAAAVSAETATTSASVGDRFTKATVPDDLGATLAA